MYSKISAAILGYALGEAFGLPLNYQSREKLLTNPVTKLTQLADLPIGTWSSGTSSILALLDAVIQKEKMDYNKIADNMVLWYKTAKYTATDTLIDIDFTTKHALSKYFDLKIDAPKCGGDGYSDCGNEPLARMIPVAFYLYYTKSRNYDIYSVVKNVTSITHQNEIAIMASYIFTRYVLFLLHGKDKLASYSMLKSLDYTLYFKNETIKEFDNILKNNVYIYSLERISSNNYIVDTLEAFFYCLINSASFKQALIGSVNLGNQASSLGGLTSAVAAIYYGYESIPKNLLDSLRKKDYLLEASLKYENVLKIL